VIAILGILAGVVVFSVAGITDNGQVAACKTEASTVRAAEEAFYAKSTASPKIYSAGNALDTAGLLAADPTLVSVTLSAAVTGPPALPAGASYTMSYIGTTCSGAGTP
jgi:general secretion pathway protein G